MPILVEVEDENRRCVEWAIGASGRTGYWELVLRAAPAGLR
jgi:hypothetical protein